jgi:ribosomal protein S18 acetylase RimI-like enzyme
MDEMHWLSDRSWRRLVGVRPELAAIVARALQLAPFDFTVLEGLRTRQRQAELVAEGATAVAIDPSPDNKRAVRAYLRAGFAPRGIVPCEDGDPVRIMVFHRRS